MPTLSPTTQPLRTVERSAVDRSPLRVPVVISIKRPTDDQEEYDVAVLLDESPKGDWDYFCLGFDIGVIAVVIIFVLAKRSEYVCKDKNSVEN